MTDRKWDAEVADAMLAQNNVPPAPPLELVVIGSTDFDEPFVVQAALLAWSQRHQGNVILWTTGAPDGAEHEARLVAQRSGWSAAEMRPEHMLESHPTATYAFVTPGSEAEALAADIGARRPVRKFTVESMRPRSRWATW